jgi:indole-3-glycerol phosphate synthase
MPDFLQQLINDAKRRISSGYYDISAEVKHAPLSLTQVLKSSAKMNAIIAEIKPISPTRGPLRPTIDPVEAAINLIKGGAVALSVLTEPDNFGGNLASLALIRTAVTVPLLMKDIVIDGVQIEAARKSGSDCVLLIESIFSTHHQGSINNLIDLAHQSNMEVLLEAHSADELERAINSNADIIGINNRNLETLEIDLETTTRLISKISKPAGKALISESGLETADDVRRLKTTSVDGFLIGSSIMLANDLESKVREFVLA